MISRLGTFVEARLAPRLEWLAQRLLPVLHLPRSPTIEEAKRTLGHLRAENRFFKHAAAWLSVNLLLILGNLTDGSDEPWSLPFFFFWGMGLVLHGFAVRRRRRRFLARDPTADSPDESPTESMKLRTELMRSSEAARDVLRSLSPEILADITRGETQALAGVSMLANTERLARSQSSRIDRDLRRRTVARLAEITRPDDRQPFEDLLHELDTHERKLGTIERQARQRRQRIDSFLLALQGVRGVAGTGAEAAARVTAPLLERIELLDEETSDTDTAALLAAPDESERFREEVRLAQDLQRSILPAAAPVVAGLRVAHVYRPSNEVGGDFYDFYDLGKGRLMVAIGDASGHGIDSSMVSSMAKSAVYMQIATLRGGDENRLSDAMANINQMMCDTIGRRRLMTLTLVVFDTRGRQISWINAGHVYPILRRGSRVNELEQPGYPLGIRRQTTYRVSRETLESGDLVVLLTDGCVEAADSRGELFGWEPVTERLRKTEGADVDTVLAGISGDLDDHLSGTPLQDDVTFVAVSYQP